MKRILLFLITGLVTFFLSLPVASAFGWKGVVEMHRAGIADSLILQKIEYSGTTFHLNADDMEALKEAGVSDAVISAMLRTEYEPGYDDRGDDYDYEDDVYRFGRRSYHYPHGGVHLNLGFGCYAPYGWYYDDYWYPRYRPPLTRSYYGGYRYPRYRYPYRERSGYRDYPRYRDRPHDYGHARYRSRVGDRIDTGYRRYIGYRTRSGASNPHHAGNGVRSRRR